MLEDLGSPAYAGIGPLYRWLSLDIDGFPRVCGDRPDPGAAVNAILEVPPRMRG